MKKTIHQNPPIIIIGMHRSGTTLMTNILEKIGLNIGVRRDDNYESSFFQNLNKMLMNMAGASWDNPMPMRLLYDNPEFSKLASEAIRSKVDSVEILSHVGVRNYIKHSVVGDRPWIWGWKDPRNTFTIRTWLKIFPNAKILHVHRHGIDVAASLKTRSDFVLENGKIRKNRHQVPFFLNDKRSYPGLSSRCSDISEGINLWSEYMLEASYIESKFGGSFLNIKYEDLLHEPHTVVSKVAVFLGLNVEQKDIHSACKFINSDRAYAYKKSKYLKYEAKHKDILKKFGYS